MALKYELGRVINEIAELVRKVYNVDGPVSDIDSVVSRMGGRVIEDPVIYDFSDGQIRKIGDSEFEIIVSPFQSLERRNFAIAHELGHLFLHMDFMTDSDKLRKQSKEVYYRNGNSELEYQANEFAAAFLMPRKDYKNKLDEHIKGNMVNTEKIARYFFVCKVDENECFFTKFIGSGIIRTPHIKLKCCDSIKEEMIQSACRKEVKLSNMQMNAVKNYVKNYEQWADKLLAAFAYPAGCGSYNVAPKCQIKGNDFSTVYVGSGIMIKDGKIHFINEAEKEFSKKRFQRAFFEAKELLKGYQYISGKGVLCGDTRIRKKISEFTINDTIHVPSYKESLVLWRKQLKREVKRINKAMDTMIKEKEKILFEKYNKLLSDFLLQDILKTVSLNNDYVTEKTVCSILRGTQLSNPAVKCTSNAGKYNILTIEEVSAAIKQLLKSELLEKKKIRGCYGSYNIVKLTPDGEKCINIIPFMKKGGSIDAVNKFNRMKKNEIDIKQYFILLDIIFKNPSFFCVYQYEVIPVFANAPKEFFTLVKMRKSIEENRFRLKVYRMIVKK